MAEVDFAARLPPRPATAGPSRRELAQGLTLARSPGSSDEAEASRPQTALALPPSPGTQVRRGLDRVSSAAKFEAIKMPLMKGGVFATPARTAEYYAERAQQRLAVENGNFALALADFERAIALRPRSFRVLHARALAYARAGQLEKAIEDLNRAIDCLPRLSILHCDVPLARERSAVFASRAHAWQASGRLDDALDDFSTALLFRPESVELFTARGTCLRKLGRFIESTEDYNAARSLTRPTFPEYARAHRVKRFTPDKVLKIARRMVEDERLEAAALAHDAEMAELARLTAEPEDDVVLVSEPGGPASGAHSARDSSSPRPGANKSTPGSGHGSRPDSAPGSRKDSRAVPLGVRRGSRADPRRPSREESGSGSSSRRQSTLGAGAQQPRDDHGAPGQVRSAGRRGLTIDVDEPEPAPSHAISPSPSSRRASFARPPPSPVGNRPIATALGLAGGRRLSTGPGRRISLNTSETSSSPVIRTPGKRPVLQRQFSIFAEGRGDDFEERKETVTTDDAALCVQVLGTPPEERTAEEEAMLCEVLCKGAGASSTFHNLAGHFADPRRMREVLSLLSLETLAAGEMLTSRSQRVEHAFLLLSGSMRVACDGPPDRPNVFYDEASPPSLEALEAQGYRHVVWARRPDYTVELRVRLVSGDCFGAHTLGSTSELEARLANGDDQPTDRSRPGGCDAIAAKPTLAIRVPLDALERNFLRMRDEDCQEIYVLLADMFLFKEYPPHKLLRLSRLMHTRRHLRGETLIRQDEPLGDICLIASGHCKAYRDVPKPGGGSVRVELCTLYARNWFGEAPVVDPQAMDAFATVVTEAVTVTYTLPSVHRDELEPVMHSLREDYVDRYRPDRELLRRHAEGKRWARERSKVVEGVLRERDQLRALRKWH